MYELVRKNYENAADTVTTPVFTVTVLADGYEVKDGILTFFTRSLFFGKKPVVSYAPGYWIRVRPLDPYTLEEDVKK